MNPHRMTGMLTETQQRFIDAAKASGATSAAGARLAAELPGIPSLELIELLDAGIVREGAEGSYYLYDRPRSDYVPTRQPEPSKPVPRAVLIALQILFLVGLPLLMLWLSRGALRGD